MAGPGDKPNLFVAESPSSSEAEAYHFLRLAVKSVGSATPPKTLLVASAGTSGLPKSTLVANLAIAFPVDRR